MAKAKDTADAAEAAMANKFFVGYDLPNGLPGAPGEHLWFRAEFEHWSEALTKFEELERKLYPAYLEQRAAGNNYNAFIFLATGSTPDQFNKIPNAIILDDHVPEFAKPFFGLPFSALAEATETPAETPAEAPVEETAEITG